MHDNSLTLICLFTMSRMQWDGGCREDIHWRMDKGSPRSQGPLSGAERAASAQQIMGGTRQVHLHLPTQKYLWSTQVKLST